MKLVNESLNYFDY